MAIEAEETEEAEAAYTYTNADRGYIQIQAPGVPYSALRIPFPNDPTLVEPEIDRLVMAAEYLAGVWKQLTATPPGEPDREPYYEDAPRTRQQPRTPPPRRAGPVQPPPRRPQQQQQAGGRAERYQEYEGEFCDICDGPVGIYPRTGSMRSDKLVCLGRCMDKGAGGRDFIHTVRWLDN